MAPIVSSELVTLIRIYLGSSTPAELPTRLNAKMLLEEARLSGLIPLLYHHSTCDRFPEEIRAPLKRAYIAHTAHFSRLARSLLAICSQFQRDGVAAIPFKGLGLSQRLFGDVQFRLNTDHDLLIKRHQIEAAVVSLQKSGFRTLQPLQELSKFCSHFYSLEFRHPGSGALVDLQWDLANGYISMPLDEEELFRRTATLSILNQPVPFFDDTITLFLLCAHGAKNCWCELRALLDMAMMMKIMDESVWQEAAQWMHERGILTMLTTGVLLTNRLFGTAIPAAAAARISPRAHKLAASIQNHWQQRGGERPSARQRFLWDLHFREGAAETKRYLFFRMRPTKTDMRNKRTQGFSLYARRLARILSPRSSQA